MITLLYVFKMERVIFYFLCLATMVYSKDCTGAGLVPFREAMASLVNLSLADFDERSDINFFAFESDQSSGMVISYQITIQDQKQVCFL